MQLTYMNKRGERVHKKVSCDLCRRSCRSEEIKARRLICNPCAEILKELKLAHLLDLPYPSRAQRNKNGTETERTKIFSRDEHRCVRCKSPKDPTVDHIVPRYLGGGHEIENKQVLCGVCNRWKELCVSYAFRAGRLQFLSELLLKKETWPPSRPPYIFKKWKKGDPYLL